MSKHKMSLNTQNVLSEKDVLAVAEIVKDDNVRTGKVNALLFVLLDDVTDMEPAAMVIEAALVLPMKIADVKEMVLEAF